MLPVSATMSNKISSFQQSRNKLNMFNLCRLCRNGEISFNIVAETGNIMSKQRSTLSKQLTAFDFVAKNGNNIERVYRKISSFRQSRMLLRHYCRFRQQYCRFRQYCCRFWQQCRTKFCLFDKLETNWTCSICVDFVKKKQNFVQHCCQNRQHCCQKR